MVLRSVWQHKHLPLLLNRKNLTHLPLPKLCKRGRQTNKCSEGEIYIVNTIPVNCGSSIKVRLARSLIIGPTPRMERSSMSVDEEIAALRERKTELESEIQKNSVMARAVDSSSESIIIADINQKDQPIIYANEAFLRMTGYSRADVIGRNCRFLQGKDTNKTTVEKIRLAITKSEPITVDIQNYKKDGTAFWNRLHLSPLITPKGKWYMAIEKDITVQKKPILEYELQSQALDATEEGIIITDMLAPDQPNIYSNEGFARMTGYHRQEIVGRNCRFLQGVDSDRNTVQEIRDSIAAHRSHVVELMNYKKDGTAFWNQFNLTPIFNDQGVCTHYIAVEYEHPLILNDNSFLKGLLLAAMTKHELGTNGPSGTASSS